MQRLIDADDVISFPYSEDAGTEEQIMDWIEECGLSDEEDRAKMLCWKVIEGFRNVVKTAPTIPAPQWISVEDGLPNQFKPVLITDGDEVEEGYLNHWGVWLKRNGIRWDKYLKTITHWMPKPEPPDKRYKCRYADDNGVCDKFTESEEIVYCTGRPCLYYTPVEVKDYGTVSK